MANGTRSTRKSKDDESTGSRKKAIIETTDTSGLRRSTRETPSRKRTSTSPSTTRKSERLESMAPTTTPVKRTIVLVDEQKISSSEPLESMAPTTTPVKRKLVSVDKQKISSPLRRSDRFKKHPSSSSSGSKKYEKGSGSLDVKSKKLQREKSLKQLTLEARETNRREKQDPKPVGVRKKKMDARTFLTYFKQQVKRDTAPDIAEELERPDKLSQDDSICCGSSGSKLVGDEEDGGEECSVRMGEKPGDKRTEEASGGETERSDSCSRNSNAEAVGNNGEIEVSCSSQKPSSMEEPCNCSDEDGFNPSKSDQRVTETLDDTESMQVDYFTVEKLQTLEIEDSGSIGGTIAGDIGKGIGDSVASKRKRSDNFVGTCLTCSKRRRENNDLAVEELCLCDVAMTKGLCYASVIKDRGQHEANVRGLDEESDCIARHESPPVQIDGHQNICFICKLGEKLLCCDGQSCKRRYHPSCLDLSWDDVPHGVWHCLSCAKKKIESGVYSVSEGVESIWDAREEEVQDTKYGSSKEKQYFVKYKGLAHIHNRWVPESQLILEAPLLISKYNQNNKVVQWREQWKTPHRLLKKRLLRFPKQQDECQIGHTGDISECHCEWLVKWCGLDYEYATWESEYASFLQSPLGQSLISKYENRHQRAKRASSSSLGDKNKKGSLVKLSKLTAGVLPGIDHNQLSSVNKLLEHWHKGQNAVFFADQERVTKMILLIESLLPNISQPFLIISDSSALSQWEAKFSHLDSSIDVVIYSGREENRKIIRTFEFYEEGGCIMFQVLVSSIEALVEDFEMLECLRWEAIIVDECQCSGIAKYFEKIKFLSTEVRFLLFNGQLKDSIAEHLNLLSLLESPSDLGSTDGPETYLHCNLAKLKERLSRFIAYDCKPDSSRFLEYWVPVLLSNVQLEQYCATLLSNYSSLRSFPKRDPVGALHNILISTRKSCDHPYIVDPHLQSVLTKDLPVVEYLDVGIKASGKLQLLDTVLSETQERGLRVVILFQSIGGSGRDSTGDILEDFIRQRFGPDSYERVDGGFLSSKKKQAALNKFNDKGSGRFALLLEIRACHSSIKLSSVDGIVIFDSDWNPTNDIRALCKLSIDSSFEQIKVFRLYSSFTVEEKVLVLATHNVTLDSNVRIISPSTTHMLLMWGASYLFNKLDEFPGGNVSTTRASIDSEPSLLKDVAKEFLRLLCQDHETPVNNSVIVKVQHVGGYRKSVSLLGELKIQLPDGEEPVVFWTKLLEGRNPQWRYSSGLSQRNRKRVQNFGNLPEKPEVETDEVGKKHKNAMNSKADPSVRPSLHEGGSRVPDGSGAQLLPSSATGVPHTLQRTHASTSPFPSNDVPASPELNMVDSEDASGMHDQESLHVLVKEEISTLSEILKLSEDVKVMVGKFLEYIIYHHRVSREPTSILQAFQISLCWVAASMLKDDRKESLLLAKRHLNFGCTEEEANNVYLKLRPLFENFKESECPQDSVRSAEDISKEPPDARMSPSKAFSQKNVKVEIEERPENQEFVEDLILFHREEATLHETEELQISNRVKRKRDDKMTMLIRKQQKEMKELIRSLEEGRVQIEKQYRLESALVRSIHSNNPVGLDKHKRLDDEFARKMEEYKRQKEIHLKDIEANHLAERNKKRQTAEQAEPSCELPLNGSEFGDTSVTRVHNGPENIVSGSRCLVEEQSPNGMLANGMAPCVVSGTDAGEAVRGGVTSETPTISLCPHHDIGAVDSITLHEALSVAPDVPVSAPNELLGAADSVETVNPGVEYLKEYNRRYSSFINDNLLSVELSLVETSLVQPVVTPAQACMSSQNVALQDEHPRASTSTAIPDTDAPARGYQNILQEEVLPLHPTDSGPTGQANDEALVIEHAEQLQLSPSADSPVNQNRLNLRSASGVQLPPQSVGQITSLNPEAPPLFENPTVPSNLAVLNLGAPRMRTQPVYADPLQIELERLQREKELTVRVYEDAKLQLKSDREKEIEEIVAEIHRKYKAKLQDAEAAFLLKNNELESNQNKVLMNKRLADAFRSKCLHLRPSGAMETQQAVPPIFTQQVNRTSSQSTPRPSPVTGTSSVVPASASQQTTSLPLQVVHHSSALFFGVPNRPSRSVAHPPSSVNLQTASEMRAPAPHLQRFRPPSSLTATSITSLSQVWPGNQQASRNFPMTSPSAPLVPSQPPPQPPPLVPSQPPPQLPPLVPSQPPPPPPPPPTYHSSPYDRAPQPEVAGGLPSLQNSSLSAMGLLFHVNNQPGAHPPNILPPLPDLCSRFGSLDISQFGAPGTEGGDGGINFNSDGSGLAADILFLSDDDE